MIYIIGIGVEGKSSLSQRALGLIEGAGALIGGRRHLACFPEFQGKKIVIGSDLNKIIKVLTPHSSLLTMLLFSPQATQISLALLIL